MRRQMVWLPLLVVLVATAGCAITLDRAPARPLATTAPLATATLPASAAANRLAMFLGDDLQVRAERDGTLLWHHSLPAGQDPGLQARDGVLYVARQGLTPFISTYRLSDGTPGWTFTACQSDDTTLQFGDGLLYVACWQNDPDRLAALRSAVQYALDPHTGAVRWRRTSAEVETFDGERAFLIVPDGIVMVNAATGTPIWSAAADLTDVKHPGEAILLTLVAAHDVVYLSSNGTDVRALRETDGTPLWRVTNPANPAVEEDSLWVGAVAGPLVIVGSHHGIYGLNAADGALRWQYSQTISFLGSDFVEANVENDGAIYALAPGSGGAFVLRRLNPLDGSTLWQTSYDNRNAGFVGFIPEYWRANGALYTFDKGAVVAIKDATGQTIWRDEGANFLGGMFDVDQQVFIFERTTLVHPTPGSAGGAGSPYGVRLDVVRVSDGRPVWHLDIPPDRTIGMMLLCSV